MAWRVTQGVLLDRDGQPYAWKGQVLAHDDPVALLKGNRRLVQEVEEPAPTPEFQPPPPPPPKVFREEPPEEENPLLDALSDEGYAEPEDDEGIEL